MSIYVSLIDGMGSATDSSGGSVTTTGAKAGDFAHLTNDIIGSEGIVNGLSVSEHSPANMSVDVSAGTCYVLNDGWSANSGDIKYWRVVSDTVENVSIDSNSSGNPRIDIIIVKIDNTVTPNDEASNVATIEVVKGTPASSPSAPATPSNALLLAEVYVADGATSITNSDIIDKREYATLTDIEGDQVAKKSELEKRNIRAEMQLQTTSASIADGTEETAPYDYKQYESNSGMVDVSNHSITVPEDGAYDIEVQIYFQDCDSGEKLQVRVVKGGSSTILIRNFITSASGYWDIGFSQSVRLSAGDEISVLVKPTSSTGNTKFRGIASGAYSRLVVSFRSDN